MENKRLNDEIHAYVNVLRTCRVRHATEAGLQRDLAAGLELAQVEFWREYHLTVAERVDLAVRCMVGLLAIEVKVSGSCGEIDRQVARYASHADVVAVVVVSSRVQHSQVARQSCGKPVHVVIRAEGAFL